MAMSFWQRGLGRLVNVVELVMGPEEQNTTEETAEEPNERHR